MKIEKIDLHGLSLEEAMEKARGNLNWCIKNEVDVLDIIHGKGHHSSRNFSVIKKEVRKMVGDLPEVQENGYKIVPGESDLPIALTFDDGHTLLVKRGLEKQFVGGKKQQEKNQRIFSNEGKKQRKEQKGINAQKRRKPR